MLQRVPVNDAFEDYIGTSTGYDLQALGQDPFEEFSVTKANVTNTKTAICGTAGGS